MTDAELLEGYATGRSPDAFAALVERHYGWVRTTALRQVRRADLADDVTQAVFIVLLQKANQLRPDVPLSGWLFNVLRYAVLNVRREEPAHGARRGPPNRR